MQATELRLVAAFGLAFVVVLVATPFAIGVANRLRLWDHPVGYKAHASPTPYLGGAAVVVGFLVGALTLGDELSRFAPVLAGMLVLAGVGLIDDWRTVRPAPRVVVEALAGALLWATDLGWHVAASEPVNLALTMAWVVGLVNAFNLMDNIDGATSTVAAVSAGGGAALALMADDPAVAGLAVALAGACIAFLRYNLAGPARIFLGDGGSMPIGFAVAATLMMLPVPGGASWTILVPATFIAGLPLIDTCLVVVSRRRRRVAVFKGGRDHITHRLQRGLPSARAVAAVLALTQTLLCAAAVLAFDGTAANALVGGALFGAAAVVAIGLFENPRWLSATRRAMSQRVARPPRPAVQHSAPALSPVLIASSSPSRQDDGSAER